MFFLINSSPGAALASLREQERHTLLCHSRLATPSKCFGRACRTLLPTIAYRIAQAGYLVGIPSQGTALRLACETYDIADIAAGRRQQVN